MHTIKPGDIIYAKRGCTTLVGKGIVESDHYYDKESHVDFPNVRKVKWVVRGEWNLEGYRFPRKTLTNISGKKDMIEYLEELIHSSSIQSYEGKRESEPYTKTDFPSEVFMDEGQYDRLVGLLKRKKNIILQGPPGVGKTYSAKRLAWSMMGVKDPSRIETVQFHQNYAYEDFVMGYKPSAEGFVLQNGIFFDFCNRAWEDAGNSYFSL